MLHIKTAEGWKPWLPSYRVCSNSNKLEGVYRPENIDVVRVKMVSRIERFLAANAVGNNLDKQQYFSGDSFNEPMYGAYGEKL